MISVHSKMTASLVAGGAALLLAVLMPAPAAPLNFSCSPAKMKIVPSSLPASTTSSTFVNIPEASVNFKQGAAGGCVVVRFSAATFAGAGQIVEIRAYLDDTIAALPPAVRYSSNDDSFFWPAHTFDFVFSSVAPGKHVVRMQFRSVFSGNVTVGLHNTIAQYAP